MRRRSTYIPSEDIDYDPSELKIEGRHLSFAGLKAAREERLTFGLSELPPEIVKLLEQSHELHVRWVSEDDYDRSGPYLSSLTSGLHVHFTPPSSGSSQDLCPLLKQLFSSSLRCSIAKIAFSTPDILSDRFASSASMQYYSVLPSLKQFVRWMQQRICSPQDVVCTHNAALLNIVSYVDVDYDSISHALTLTAFWSKPPPVLIDPIGEWTTYDHWNMALDGSLTDKNEVGILRSQPGSEAAEVQMEGFLATVGEDTSAKPTMFFFPSRHHILAHEQSSAQRYKVAFDEPTGLHPTLRISFASRYGLREPANKPADSTCALHTYLTLPSVLFADEYAFPTTDLDPLFTEAHNVVSLRSLSGERDLEAPDYVIEKWGSALLLELATPTASNLKQSDAPWEVKIPLHLRYLEPAAGGKQHVQIPWPIVFWACTAEEGTKFTVNPFDRVNLGYDGLFGPRTMFYHLDPKPAEGRRLIETLDVPVLDTDVMSFGTVEILTLVLVLGGFLWVAWKAVRQILSGMSAQAQTARKSNMKRKAKEKKTQ